MMGCLKGAVSFVVIALAIIGFFSIGGVDLVMNGVNGYLNPSHEKVVKKAQKIADFSELPQDYNIQRTVDMLGVKAVMLEYLKSDQKMIIIDKAWGLEISQKDIVSDVIDDKLEELAEKFVHKPIQIKELEIKKKDFFKIGDKKVPYVKFKMELKGTPYEEVEGFIAITETDSKDEKMLVSFNEADKFEQDVAEKLFKNIKFR